MTNKSVIKSLCTALCNTFYPDESTLNVILFNEGVDGEAEAQPKDSQLLKMAIKLVSGYVENSRSEGGISTAINVDRINSNIAIWCNDYGLDTDEFAIQVKTIQNGTYLW